MSENQNIYQRINEVKKQTSYVYREGKIKFGEGNIPVVLHDTVTDYTRAPLIKNGVIVVPQLVDCKSETIERVRVGRNKTKYTVSIYRLTAEYDILFVNADNPEDRLSVRTIAMYDQGDDKGPQALLSYAMKGVLLKVLGIVSGDEDETDDMERYQEHEHRDVDNVESREYGALPEDKGKGKVMLKHIKEKMDEAIELGLNSVKLVEGLSRAFDCKDIFDLPYSLDTVADLNALIQKAIDLKKKRLQNESGNL